MNIDVQNELDRLHFDVMRSAARLKCALEVNKLAAEAVISVRTRRDGTPCKGSKRVVEQYQNLLSTILPMLGHVELIARNMDHISEAKLAEVRGKPIESAGRVMPLH
ncbi:hypothetical protein ACIQW5_11240 [Methylorubrum thiocyanatum]|uniref:hypothetical protein n=1 Tax=Methylorubrum thiocyanatum TaxID=47958 RepID=UPI00383B1F33